MTTEPFTDKDEFLRALQNKGKKHRPRNPARPKSAIAQKPAQRVVGHSTIARSERTGLSPLLKEGWCNEYNATMEMRLYKGAISTRFYTDERQAVLAAQLLTEEEESE